MKDVVNAHSCSQKTTLVNDMHTSSKKVLYRLAYHKFSLAVQSTAWVFPDITCKDLTQEFITGQQLWVIMVTDLYNVLVTTIQVVY